MNTLKDRVIEAVDAAIERGYSVADIAKSCNCSVQSIYQWKDPLKSLKELKSKSLLGLSELSKISPWYINYGIGEKILYYAKNEAQKSTLKIMEPMDIKDQEKMPRLGHSLIEPGEGTNGKK